MASFPLISVCDPQLCNNLQAHCAVTIFFYSSCLVSVSLPSPLSILPLTAHPCPYRSSPPSPSTIATASSHQHTNARHQHTSIYTSPGSHLHILKHPRTWPFSLSLSLLSPGEHPQTWHAGTILHYNGLKTMTSKCLSGLPNPLTLTLLSTFGCISKELC